MLSNKIIIFFVASIRNFGERTVSLFSRKKKATEQTAQSVVDDVNEAATSAQNEVNDLGENAGY